MLPYRFVQDKVIRVSENPKGSKFDLGSIQQILSIRVAGIQPRGLVAGTLRPTLDSKRETERTPSAKDKKQDGLRQHWEVGRVECLTANARVITRLLLPSISERILGASVPGTQCTSAPMVADWGCVTELSAVTALAGSLLLAAAAGGLVQ